MASSETDLIERYFVDLAPSRADVLLGIGDDCAVLQVPDDRQLAVSMDTLVAGRHFLPDADPRALGHKALAVNLSDLAAMGATPAWVTMSLTLPEADHRWLGEFAAGFGDLARRHSVSLVGGDLSRGPLSITIQAHGLLPAGLAMCRQGAAIGDHVYVTGTLGDAALALRTRQGAVLVSGQGSIPALLQRLDRPEPRLAWGMALLGMASAALDLSDGLSTDLGRICAASGVGATIELAALPLSATVRAEIEHSQDWSLPLAGGDDYELCFTLSPARADDLAEIALAMQVPVTRIGRIEREPGLRAVDAAGRLLDPLPGGYDHFS